MGKIAFIFSGQGDQYSGMGKALSEEHKCALFVFDACDKLRKNTSNQCFNGTEEELKETSNTQPCLFAVEMAYISVLSQYGIKPDMVAGFSLGEVVALTYAKVVDFETGFKLVCKRGELMQKAANEYDTSMAAVVKLDENTVREICSQYSNVYPVNFNCPGQITVSGLSSEMAEFATSVKNAGGRAIPLKLKGAFHSPFMNVASDEFASVLDDIDVNSPAVTLYSNITGKQYDADIKQTLAKQICNPVRWEDTIRNMISDGVDTFIEIGPGKTLTNMVGKIDKNVKAYSVCDLETVLSEVQY